MKWKKYADEKILFFCLILLATPLLAQENASPSSPLTRFARAVVAGNRNLLAAAHELESSMLEKHKALAAFSPEFSYQLERSKASNSSFNSITGVEEDYSTRRNGVSSGITQRTPLGNLGYSYSNSKTEYTTSQTSYFSSLYLSWQAGLREQDRKLAAKLRDMNWDPGLASRYNLRKAAFDRAREMSRPDVSARLRWGKQGRSFDKNTAESMNDKSWDVVVAYSTSFGPDGRKIDFSRERPDAYPELLLPCKVQQAAPLAMEISGGKPDGRTMVRIKAALQTKNEKVKLGYSGSVFNRPAFENWQKYFRGQRKHRIRRTNIARKASTTGEVKPASFSYIVSMSSSKINFPEEEGKSIEKGHVIAKIDSAEDQQNLKDTEIELRKLKEELQLMVEKNQVEDVQLKRQIEVKSGALEVAKLRHAALLKSRDEDKIIDLRRSLELLEAKIDLAREKVAHIQNLQKKGLRSELELMQAESEVAALLKDKAITEYKLDYEDSGPGKKAIAVSELEVAKAEAEMRRTALEVSLGGLANAMNIKIKELEIRKLELRIDEYKRLLEKSEIKAPCSGVVIHNEIRKNSGGTGKAKVGDEVYARVPFMQMAEMANLQVHTEVSEMDVKFINPGDKIRILLKGNSVSTFSGWVSSVSYVAQTQFKARQDAVVKIIIDLVSPQNGVNSIDPAFRPGQSCEVEFDLYDVKDALLVPFDAVLPLASGPCLVSPDKSLKPVDILFSDGLNGCVVKSGVEEGEEILLMEAFDD